MKQLIVSLILLLVCCVQHGRTQEAAPVEGEDGRVQYTLILPDEKTPEMVKPEENNPFETMVDPGTNREGSTEENQVRDLLLAMPVGGASSGPDGIRVMLGGMRLQEGMTVPQVIPDQQVQLRVKAITPHAIELVWVEKKPTGLPPKLLVIQMDGAPKVRYRMPAGTGSQPGQKGSMGTVRRSDAAVFSTPPAPSVAKAERAEDTPPSSSSSSASSPAPKMAPLPPPTSPPPASTVPEASVLRMLFGNRPPEAK